MEQNNPHQNQTFMSIRELTISGLLAGITIFLGLTGYGFIPLVVMNATILHIPTIIGTVVAGPKVGILVGFLFGLFSFIQTLRAPSLMMQFALQYSVIADAFICIVPRICIPIVVWLLYKYIPGMRICVPASQRWAGRSRIRCSSWAPSSCWSAHRMPQRRGSLSKRSV